MRLRDVSKLNVINDGTRTLFESVVVPEVMAALKDWQKSNGGGILIGGLAMSYYARPRQTMDVDILFVYPSEIPNRVNGFKRIRSGAFQHNVTHVEIEVVTYDSFNGNVPKELIDKVNETAIESNGIKIASPSGIVALKLCRMKRYDEGDIWSLIETGKVDLTGWPINDNQTQIYQTIVQKVRGV